MKSVGTALVTALLLASCGPPDRAGPDDQTTPKAGTSNRSSCNLPVGLFAPPSELQPKSGQSANTLAVGRDGPFWNEVAISWRMAQQYVDVARQFDPPAFIRVQVDPAAPCGQLQRLIDTVSNSCRLAKCSFEKTRVDAKWAVPLEF